jgi:hypothetical protein
MSWFGGGGAAASQAAMMRQLEDMQKEDSMRTFNSVVCHKYAPKCPYGSIETSKVERCFFNCVNSFATSDLEPREEQCVYRCTEKFFRHSQRSVLAPISARFQPLTAFFIASAEWREFLQNSRCSWAMCRTTITQ